MRIWCLLLLIVGFAQVSQGAILVGLASPQFLEEGGGEGTHLFRLNLDGSDFADLGAIQLNGAPGEFDALAVRNDGQILSFQITPAGSRLTAIDLQQVTATLLSPPLFGREIRGATIGGGDKLWAIDTAANELLDVSMTTGEELAAIPLTLNGSPFEVPAATDIAVDFSGELILVAGNQIFALNSETGALTTLLTDLVGEATPPSALPPTLVGAAVGMAPSERIIALDTQGVMADDVYTYDPSDPSPRATLLTGPFGFDVELGDLALMTESVSSGDYNGDGMVDAADYLVWRNTLGSSTNLAANGNDVGTSMNRIDAADYLVWKEHFGAGTAAALVAPGQQIPEVPGRIVGVLLSSLILVKASRRQRAR